MLPPTPLRGRDRDLATLARLSSSLAGAGLLLDGEPGVGRTALLEAACRTARDAGVRVVMVTAARPRAHQPMQLLNELLGALDEHRPTVAMPSLDELVLTTLAGAAAERPTLLVVDDAHRVDERTWDALVGAVRLLHAEPVALLMTAPIGDHRVRDAGLPVLTLAPLAGADAAAVLDDVAPTLPVFVRERILEAAAGNPLALTELAAASDGEWRRRCIRPPAALPLSPRLIRSFAGPLRRLPEVTQEVLLAAAANDSRSLTEAARAAARTLGVPVEETLGACLVAVDHRIIESDATRLRFRNEVARSAIYEAAPVPRRRALHLAFVALLDEPERRAWHRAAASLEPDEALAGELEAASAVLQRRGRIRDALATVDRAARVSQDDHARARRLLVAGELSFEIGRPDFATAFIQQAAELADDPIQRQDATLLKATYELWRPDGAEGVLAGLARAERADAAGDPARVRSALTRAVEAVEVCAPGALPLRAIDATARRLGGLRRTPALAGVLTCATPVEHGGAVLDAIRALPPDAGGDPRLARLLGEAASLLGDDGLARRSLSAAVDALRTRGSLGLLAFALVDRARVHVTVSSLGLAGQDAAEAALLGAETDQPVVVGRARAVQALVGALAGDLEASRAHADEAERLAFGRPALLVDVHVARGLADLVGGDHEAALSWLLRLWEPTAPTIALHRRWPRIGDLAEAAVVCGEADAVRPLVDELALTAAALPSPALRAAVARAQAVLLGDREEADDLFGVALATGAEHGPLAAGRSQLAYGTWLRRRRRVTAARLALRAAVAAFDQVGAAPWSARAAAELRASGIAVAPPAEALAELTAQERQIAELAATGLSNREIGARLFLSHRTVSTHLYHAFPKLGITSRAQLRDVLGDAAGAGPTQGLG